MGKSRIRVDVEGLDELRTRLSAMGREARAAAESAVGEETEAVAQEMRDGAPVGKTRELTESIQAEHDGTEGTAAATADHAWWVEVGTSKMTAQPYAEPAAETSRTRFPERLTDVVSSAVD